MSLPLTPGSTPLHAAASEGHVEVVSHLLSLGANPNAVDAFGTPVLIASLEHASVTQALLNAGAHVDAPWPHLGSTSTPLMVACSAELAESAAALLRHGASPRFTNSKGHTPLHMAAWGTDPSLVQLLVAAGADVAAVDADGRTALMHAIQTGTSSQAVWTALVDAGVPVDAVQPGAGTALLQACVQGQYDTAHWLLSRGANTEAAENPADPTPLLTVLLQPPTRRTASTATACRVSSAANRARLALLLLEHNASPLAPAHRPTGDTIPVLAARAAAAEPSGGPDGDEEVSPFVPVLAAVLRALPAGSRLPLPAAHRHRNKPGEAPHASFEAVSHLLSHHRGALAAVTGVALACGLRWGLGRAGTWVVLLWGASSGRRV